MFTDYVCTDLKGLIWYKISHTFYATKRLPELLTMFNSKTYAIRRYVGILKKIFTTKRISPAEYQAIEKEAQAHFFSMSTKPAKEETEEGNRSGLNLTIEDCAEFGFMRKNSSGVLEWITKP